MNERTAHPVPQRPGAHPALRRAMTAAMAADLAEQVCQVPAEREAMLAHLEARSDVLDAVLAPAAGALFAAWIEDVGSHRPLEPDELDERGAARRATFAALCAAVAHQAWTCAAAHRAHIYAYRSLSTDPDAPSATAARRTLQAAHDGHRWSPTAPARKAEADAALARHRAGQAI